METIYSIKGLNLEKLEFLGEKGIMIKENGKYYPSPGLFLVIFSEFSVLSENDETDSLFILDDFSLLDKKKCKENVFVVTSTEYYYNQSYGKLYRKRNAFDEDILQKIEDFVESFRDPYQEDSDFVTYVRGILELCERGNKLCKKVTKIFKNQNTSKIEEKITKLIEKKSEEFELEGIQLKKLKNKSTLFRNSCFFVGNIPHISEHLKTLDLDEKNHLLESGFYGDELEFSPLEPPENTIEYFMECVYKLEELYRFKNLNVVVGESLRTDCGFFYGNNSSICFLGTEKFEEENPICIFKCSIYPSIFGVLSSGHEYDTEVTSIISYKGKEYLCPITTENVRFLYKNGIKKLIKQNKKIDHVDFFIPSPIYEYQENSLESNANSPFDMNSDIFELSRNKKRNHTLSREDDNYS